MPETRVGGKLMIGAHKVDNYTEVAYALNKESYSKDKPFTDLGVLHQIIQFFVANNQSIYTPFKYNGQIRVSKEVATYVRAANPTSKR